MNKPAAPSRLSGARARNGMQFLKFAFVGATATGLHYAIFLALVMFLDVAPGLAAAIGACFGACVVYILNRRYTFTTERSHKETIPRFVALSVLGAVLNGAIVGWLSGIGLHFLLSQVVATVLVLFINFVVSKKWIYR
ncbi:GtrA family protein [Massilia sp.]|uniref:GtrA family protein n=1 Tax=Massilia sp. TaxID=1882437 RepID=UPI00289D9CBF|nr:GtrA family protein [Massilia sp.]